MSSTFKNNSISFKNSLNSKAILIATIITIIISIIIIP